MEKFKNFLTNLLIVLLILTISVIIIGIGIILIGMVWRGVLTVWDFIL